MRRRRSKEEAYRQTISELDDLHPLREAEKAHRMPKHEAVPPGEGRQGSLPEDLWRDLRYAVRAMRKSPLFVVFVVLTLAFGIGANTTVFSVINTLILNPLPVSDSSTLAAVAMTETAERGEIRRADPALVRRFQGLSSAKWRVSLVGGLYVLARGDLECREPPPSAFSVELVTGNYFSTLGIRPAAGRFFLPEEAATPGARPVAVLNYGTWKSRFGGGTDIVGTTLRLNNVAYTIVGVAPPRFIGINAIMGPDLWIPATMAEQLLPNEMQAALSDRAKGVFLGVGRFQPGITRAGAQANLATIAADLAREYPADHAGQTATVTSYPRHLVRQRHNGILGGCLRQRAVVGRGRNRTADCVFECGQPHAGALGGAAAGDGGAASDGSKPAEAFPPASHRKHAAGLAQRRARHPDRRGRAAAPVRDAARGRQFRSAEDGFDGARLSPCSSPSQRDSVRRRPGIQSFRASVAEALKQSARTTGRSRGGVSSPMPCWWARWHFLSPAGHRRFIPAEHPAGVRIDPGFQTAHLAVFMTNSGTGRLRQAATRAFYGMSAAAWRVFRASRRYRGPPICRCGPEP